MQYVMILKAPPDDVGCFAPLVALAESRLALGGEVSTVEVVRGSASAQATLAVAMSVAASKPSDETRRSLERTLRGALEVKQHPRRSVEVILVDG